VYCHKIIVHDLSKLQMSGVISKNIGTFILLEYSKLICGSGTDSRE